MRATDWIQRKRLAAMSAIAVTALAVAAGQAIPASASAAAKPAQQPSGQAAGSVDSKLVKPSEKTGVVPGTVIAVLSGTSVTGSRLRADSTMLAPKTSSAVVNTALSRLGATSIQPLFGGLSSAAAQTLTSSARQKIGASALNLGNIVVVHVTKGTATAAAKTLAATSGVSFAEPDRYVETMDTGGQTLTTGHRVHRIHRDPGEPAQGGGRQGGHARGRGAAHQLRS